MELLGTIGLGIVWGWLLAQFCGQSRLRPQSIATLAVAIIALGYVVYQYAGKSGLFVLVISVASGLAFRVTWQDELRRRLTGTKE